MRMSTPNYSPGDIVYLKESASIGMLETMMVSGVHLTSAGWLYTFRTRRAQPTIPTTFGDRISFTTGAVLYFSEDEMLTKCEALALAEAAIQRSLTAIQLQQQSC